VEGKTQPVTLKDVKEIVGKGGTILGTSRTNPFKKEGAVPKCLETFKNLKLGRAGGDGREDTLGVANKFFKEHKLPVVGVPKTMDKRPFRHPTTPSVLIRRRPSRGCRRALRDTGRSHRRIMVLEVMGRHAGWVALVYGDRFRRRLGASAGARGRPPGMYAHLKRSMPATTWRLL